MITLLIACFAAAGTLFIAKVDYRKPRY